MQPAIVSHFIDSLRDAFREGDPQSDTKQAEFGNVCLIQRQYEAIARGDFAAAVAFFSDDIEMEIVGPPELPFLRHASGRAAVSEAMRHNFAQLTDQQPEIDSVTAQGDTVVVFGRERGRYASTGHDYALHWVQRFHFRDGKVVRFRELAEHAPLLEAAR